MAQTVQILRASPPGTLLPGALSVELGAQTKLWVGAAAGNRLLLSSDPVDTPVISTAFVKLAGSTMTGFLTLSGAPTANLHAATKLYVDTGDTAARAYADTQDNAIKAAYLPLAGGTMTGFLTLSGAPTANLHAATKLYVDTADNLRAPLASPVFTGDPRAPTPATTDNDTSIATTAFVKAQGYVTGGPYLPLAGGTVTGNLTVNGSVAAGLDVTAGRNMSVAGTFFGGALSGSTLNLTGLLTGAAANFGSNVSVAGQVATNAIQFPNYGMTSPATNIGFGYDYSGGYLWVVPNGSFAGFLGPVTSDERLKRDIRPITVDPLAMLCRVQLKAFNQLSTRLDPADGVRSHDVGFIAQQLREIIPDAVIEPPIEDAFLGLDLMPLVAYCVGAIQQLVQRLEKMDVQPD